jgi:hypothetical protein
MQPPTHDPRSHASLLAAVVGSILATIGLAQTLGALYFAAELIESDRGGGLFGFRIGMVLVVFVCVPMALMGALYLAGGIGAALRKRWGYIASIVGAAMQAGGAALALLFSVGRMSSSGVALLAVVALALAAGVIATMVRALRA